MATINIDKNDIPLKAYLRADSHSQHFKFIDCPDELVTEEMFWGDMTNTGLYLDYSKMQGRNIDVSVGISDIATIETKYNCDCDEWIDKNLLNTEFSKLFVIQGYAGCGKTTFINHFIRKNTSNKNIYIDVGQDWSYPQEPYMFFNETLNEFDSIIREIVDKRETRDLIWKEFIAFGMDKSIRTFDIEIKNILTRFEDIKKEKKWRNLESGLHAFLFNSYSEKNVIRKNRNQIWNNIGQTQTIVSLIILLQCAKNLIEKAEPYSLTIIFDNLDVITNPAIPAENIVLLWGVIDHFIKFCDEYKNEKLKKLINVKMIILVRKVLYSHIISNLPDLEMSLHNIPENINICDISNLYLSQEILKHRIAIWKKLTIDKETDNKFKQLEIITSVHSCGNVQIDEDFENDFQVKTMINIDALFNHNYRAFSNILAIFIENPQYYQLLLEDTKILHKSYNWKKVSTQIFLISLLYRKERIWNTMGFGCKDFNTIDYPTTLNRLILNYLFISKRGYYLNQLGINRNDIPTSDFVSLKDCIDLFSKIKFITIKTNYSQDEIDRKYAESPAITEDLLLDRLSDMCARNPMSYCIKASGYDSYDDELWRRPLYFVGGVKLNHTATSKDELKAYFENSIRENKAEDIKFSITDEGFILIRDVVADFEFYSARYCSMELAKPLHQAEDSSEINTLVEPVYNAIRICCERNSIFRKQYTKNYKIDNSKYFKRLFHPRTNPRFYKNQGKRQLVKNTFREQLHIVRVIYNHCYYFDTVKEYFSNSDFSDKNEMCKALTTWIEQYLKLYKTYFFNVLKTSGCNADNNIYNDLYSLVDEQKKHYVNNDDFENVNINRKYTKKNNLY